jgi:hypothetical protein
MPGGHLRPGDGCCEAATPLHPSNKRRQDAGFPASHGVQPPARCGSRNRVLARENAGMAYELEILDGIAGAEPSSIIAAIDAAIAASGSWERFVEVRMSAGPTVCITADGQDGYEVSVTWGCQHGNLMARDLQSAIECADRLAYAFYQMRDAKMIQD